MLNKSLAIPYLKHARWSITRHRPLGLAERLRAIGQRSQRLNSRPHSLREEYSFKGQRPDGSTALSHARKIRYIHSLLLLLMLMLLMCFSLLKVAIYSISLNLKIKLTLTTYYKPLFYSDLGANTLLIFLSL